MMQAGPLPHARLLSADRRGRERGRRRCPTIIQEMLLTTTSERQGRRDRPRPGRVDGEEEAGGVLLMARRTSRPRSPTTSRQYLDVARAQEPAALHHLRQRRRRQEHADRAAALRVEDGLRGPARRARGRLEEVGTQGGELDFALLVDGLAAEREQGITIDVAYRFFSTDAAQVHRRRHAGARAVHAQHGHRRLDRRRAP